jgi:hypothetical protein
LERTDADGQVNHRQPQVPGEPLDRRASPPRLRHRANPRYRRYRHVAHSDVDLRLKLSAMLELVQAKRDRGKPLMPTLQGSRKYPQRHAADSGNLKFADLKTMHHSQVT